MTFLCFVLISTAPGPGFVNRMIEPRLCIPLLYSLAEKSVATEGHAGSFRCWNRVS